MKRLGFIAILLSLMLSLGKPNAVSHSSFNSPFDEYGNICWEDETARLDNFAIALQNTERTTLGHIIVYDGKRYCRGEAVARAIRAKKYLVEYRGIEANRIVWRWGGYLGAMATQLVISPRGAAMWEFRRSLSRDEVTLIGNCNGKVRRVKCPKWDEPNRSSRPLRPSASRAA